MAQVAKLQKALMLSLLAFEEHYQEGLKSEKQAFEELSEQEQEDFDEDNNEFPEELEEDEFVEKFTDWLSSETLEAFMDAKLEPSDEKRLDIMLGRTKK